MEVHTFFVVIFVISSCWYWTVAVVEVFFIGLFAFFFVFEFWCIQLYKGICLFLLCNSSELWWLPFQRVLTSIKVISDDKSNQTSFSINWRSFHKNHFIIIWLIIIGCELWPLSVFLYWNNIFNCCFCFIWTFLLCFLWEVEKSYWPYINLAILKRGVAILLRVTKFWHKIFSIIWSNQPKIQCFVYI